MSCSALRAGEFAEPPVRRSFRPLRLLAGREQALLRQALILAGAPCSLLALGAGRFWPLLAAPRERFLLAAEASPPDLEAAREACRAQAPELLARIATFVAAGRRFELADGAVDCAFCWQPPPQFAGVAGRAALWRELHRISRTAVVVALPPAGCWPFRRAGGATHALLVAEFAAAGFSLLGYRDVLPGACGRRLYTLRKAG